MNKGFWVVSKSIDLLESCGTAWIHLLVVEHHVFLFLLEILELVEIPSGLVDEEIGEELGYSDCVRLVVEVNRSGPFELVFLWMVLCGPDWIPLTCNHWYIYIYVRTKLQPVSLIRICSFVLIFLSLYFLRIIVKKNKFFRYCTDKIQPVKQGKSVLKLEISSPLNIQYIMIFNNKLRSLVPRVIQLYMLCMK